MGPKQDHPPTRFPFCDEVARTWGFDGWDGLVAEVRRHGTLAGADPILAIAAQRRRRAPHQGYVTPAEILELNDSVAGAGLHCGYDDSGRLIVATEPLTRIT